MTKLKTFYPMLLLAMGLALASLAFTAAPAFACGGTVLCVDEDAPGPSHDGLSWATAYTNLQDALAAATSGNEIWVAEGVYYPDQGGGQIAGNQAASFFLKSGVAIYGGFAGVETLRTQRDWLTHITVLSGDLAGDDTADAHGVVLDWEDVVGTDNTYQIVTAGYYNGSDVTVDSTAVLDGFTITAGRDFRDAVRQGAGAGLFTYKSNPTLRHLVFSGNQARVGGGMYLWEGPAITMTGLTFTGNVATQGGGLYCRNIPLTLDQFLFQNNETRNLTAAAQFGGGMAATCNLTLTNGQFIGNTAGNAGGLLTSGGPVSLNQVVFDGNHATEDNIGAGGMVSDAGNPVLTDVTFKNNTSNGWSGGYHHQGSALSLNRVSFIDNANNRGPGGGLGTIGASVTITDALFAGNNAAGGPGGGGLIMYSNSLTMTNTVFQGNSGVLGGGLFLEDVTATLRNVTVSGNQAGDGGGSSLMYSSLQVSNSILYGNPGGAIRSDSSVVSAAYSILSGGCPSGATCDHVSDTDPLFVLPVVQGNVPTSTGNLRLRPISPAIDAGNNYAVPAGLTTDLDGNPRFIDIPEAADTGLGIPPLVDRGAYEYRGLPDLEVSKTNDVGGVVAANTPFRWMLTVRNTGGDTAIFAANTVILQDDLPTANASYAASASIENAAGLSGPINCTVSAYTLTCRANGGAVTLAAAGQFTVAIPVTTSGIPILVNPRSGGACRVDPNNVILELREENNACNSDTVVVGQTSLSVAIHDAGHTPIVQAPTGTMIHASITVTGVGATPTGVTHLYRYNNATCSGAPTNTSDQNLVNGTVETASFAAASFYYRALYSGDSTHEAVYSPCAQFRAYQAGPTFTVNTPADDNDTVDSFLCSDLHCTLREAILAANGAAGANTILFNIGSGQTITLTAALPAINDASGELTIDGQTNAVTVSGNDQYRLFTVNNNARATLANLTLVDGHYTGGDCSPRSCGGGLKVEAGATVTLAHSAIVSSTASGSGGGIYNAGMLTIQQSTLAGNSSDEGGGILNYGGALLIQQSALTENTALYGGGILMVGGTLTLENSTLSGNNATGTAASGGGGAIDLYDGAAAIRNSTITNNTAVSPNQAKSGLWLENGTLSLRNSLVANNSGANNFYITSGTFTSQGYNLANAWNGLTTQSTDLTGAPKLGPLADYGGPTQTHRLLPGSPAIDAGANDGCPTQDQRGMNRLGTCDIGAFEWQGFTLGQLTGAPQSAVLTTAFAQPLGLTVTANDTGEPVAGVVISFSAPASGASIAETTPILRSSGVDGSVSVAVTANGVAGSYNVTASAAGAASVNFALTNSRMDTTLELSSSLNPAIAGDLITFTAQVVAARPGAGVPSGVVTFTLDGVQIDRPLDAAGAATYSTSTLAVGVHTLSAAYGGDANYNASPSSQYDQVVNSPYRHWLYLPVVFKQ
jgi:CSLREA domain-containing protein